MGFGGRLRQERKRLGFKQAEFAALAGTDAPKQSLYENGHRQLRADYLARLDPLGIDLLYVLTGRRREGFLDEGTSEMLAGWRALPAELRRAVERLIADFERLDPGPGRGGRDRGNP
ncbi:MAG TPA: helix-turn-helix transcriptional regulator [Allosphingosinicella sp.]|nr:helix-turn-helix transcriptional regulator [Allosphingosinicella sp.]